jgi:hypothetical protein
MSEEVITGRKLQTRKSNCCPVFGFPAEMRENQLPTYGDIMKNFLSFRHAMKPNDTCKEPTVVDVAMKLAPIIEKLWHKASLPIISHKRVVEKIRLYHDKYRNLLKPLKSRQGDQSYEAKIQCFAAEANSQLFDISACKCLDFQTCKCPLDRKVPTAERLFLSDQRSARNMMIGGVDLKTTTTIMRREKRKKQAADFALKRLKSTVSNDIEGDDEDLAVEDSADDHVSDMDVAEQEDSNYISSQTIEQPSRKKQTQSQMRLNLAKVAQECDRYGVSDRCAASIVSAVLEDVGLVNASDCSKVIDRSKLRRERTKVRMRLQTESKKTLSGGGLYFDGRKDRTRVIQKKGAKYYARVINEEHVSLVHEPESQYLGHIAPSSGHASSIVTGILHFLRTNEIDTDGLMAIGCDGTNVNTGAVGGVISLLEKELGRSLQWFICLLHANELPLRHLVQKLDGGTRGPSVFSGAIGKALPNCEELPVAHFNSIEFENCPPVDGSDLSTDQKYLHDMCQAISSGHCPESLAMQKPGPVVHSRWLTTANRLLRLYIATEKPNHNLVSLATYVVKVYAPIWFSVKTNSACSEGARHVWKMIKLSRYLKPELRAVVDSVIQRNGYSCHSENLLLAMLTDERSHIRELACRRILAARRENVSTTTRQFRVPKLNFAADDYIDLVTWSTTDRCEPPLLKQVSDSELQACIQNSAKILQLPQLPCHTQATERCIKLVTEASAAVCGPERRDGFIRSRIASRKLMKTFNTKAEYRLAE